MSEDIISHEFAGLDATDVSCYGVRSHNVGSEGATPIQRGFNACARLRHRCNDAFLLGPRSSPAPLNRTDYFNLRLRHWNVPPISPRLLFEPI